MVSSIDLKVSNNKWLANKVDEELAEFERLEAEILKVDNHVQSVETMTLHPAKGP